MEDYEFEKDELLRINVLICVLNQLPKGCSLWVGDYILDAFHDGWLIKMKDYYLKKENYYDFFDLSPECIKYIERELLKYPEFISYFCHYGIVHPDRKFLRVLDGEIFEIDPSINVPEWLIYECAQHGIYVYREEVLKIGL